MNLFEKIENLKKEQKIKNSEIAKHMGVSRQCFHYHYNNLRNGSLTFSLRKLKILAKVLKTDINIFFEF